MQKITTCLWFDGKAEEAANFYTSIFESSKISDIMYCGKAGPGPEGSVLSVTFELDGRQFIALNGGPCFTFTPAISMFITCRDQAEVDMFWQRLGEGGEPQRCGWLKDKFGVSWQIVPAALGAMLQERDAERSTRLMRALLTMEKLDAARLRQACEQS